MIPFKDIKIGDMYKRGYPWTLEWLVLDKNTEEKMIKIVACTSNTSPSFNKPFWKSYRDKLFSLPNRVLEGHENKEDQA